jgi:peptide-methionine (S)-S-oxide reductase
MRDRLSAATAQVAGARWVLIAGLVLALLGAFWRVSGEAADSGTVIPAPALDSRAAGSAAQTIVLAGGCFWGVQLVYQHVKGVSSAVSGYAGGSKETANYEVVSSGRTGHAESVEVTFDSRQVSLGRILQIFFSVAHDPTQLNRQGPDYGPQYRSAIFYRDEPQKKIVDAYIAQLDKANVFGRKIVTQVAPFTGFYPAEAYHQDYATIHPSSPYIAINDLPKAENLKRLYADSYRERPVLISEAIRSN